MLGSMVGKRDRCWRTDGERRVMFTSEGEKTDVTSKQAAEASRGTLFQVLQAGLLSLQDGAHATQSGSLQLFTPIQRVSVLHQPHVVFGDAGRGGV